MWSLEHDYPNPEDIEEAVAEYWRLKHIRPIAYDLGFMVSDPATGAEIETWNC